MPHSAMKTLPCSAIWGPPAGSTNRNAILAALIVLLALVFYLAAGCLACRGAQAAGASDLQGHWAAPEIARAIDAGYARGYPDGRFRPNAGVTRAEFVSMAGSAFRITAGGNPASFTDVQAADWFSGSVRAAVYAGLASGYPDGNFRPQQGVSRQEAACMLAQVMHLQQDGLLSYTDDSQIAGWARPLVGKLVAKGIIAGYPDGSFLPQKIISRAEAVVLINRALSSQAAVQAQDEPSRGHPGTLTVEVRHDQTGEVVDITGASGGSCRWVEKTGPQRLVVTVPGITVVRTPLEIPAGGGGLDRVVTSFPGADPGSADVEISFSPSVPLVYHASLGTPGELLITVPPQIYEIEAVPGGDNLDVNIRGTGPLKFQASTLSNPGRLVFDFAGFSLADGLKEWQQQVNTAGVEALVLSQYQPGVARLVAGAAAGLAYTAASSDGGQQLALHLKKSANPVNPPANSGNSGPQGVLAGKSVVLDPGHGGNDSGALGKHGAQEKWVNLAIATRAAEILRQLGADVTMTRTGDTNPDLYARPELANSLQADVFVSIHANSSSKSSMSGTGTYTYAPPGTALGKQRDARLHLASLLQENLTATLGLRSCGIFENRFAVLRCANMPAALVEVAFISNAWEERLLGDSSFQQQAAAAIAGGITSFLTGK